MKDIQSDRTLVNSVPFKTIEFGIKSKNLGHIIHILRDQIYSDKILAVIREYSCNAFDANVMSGKPNEPIIVTLPNKLSPEFKVRDFGFGLSEQDITEIFVSYGESTKRQTNDAVGFLGIGAKSGFAYGSNFLVTSYNNGTKTVYDCVLDKTNVGHCLVLTSEPMSIDDKEGLEITVPVRMEDVTYFVSKAVNFYKYWNVKPSLTNYQTEMEQALKGNNEVLFEGKDKDWVINVKNNRGYDNNRYSIALMGNIPYPVKWETVRVADSTNNDRQSLISMLQSNSLLMKFPIGSLQFAPSRETLQYTDYTNEALIKMMNKILLEIGSVIQKKFDDCKTLLEALTLYHNTFEEYYSGLHCLRDSIKVSWKGIPITSSDIEGLEYLDASRGHSVKPWRDGTDWVPVMKRFETTRQGNLRCHNGERYECRRIHFHCNTNFKLLLLDSDKHTYIRKAVKYLMQQDVTVTRVYVFQFLTQKAKDDAYLKLSLNHLGVTSYSAILPQVKASIVRARPSGPVVPVGERYVKTFTIQEPSRFSYNRYTVSTEAMDLSKMTGGYYFKIVDTNTVSLNGKNVTMETAVVNINRIVYIVNNLCGKKITKVFGFNSRIYDNKKVDISKFTSIDTVITELSTFLDTDTKYKYIVGHGEVRDNIYKGDYIQKTVMAVTKKSDITKSDSCFYKLANIISTNGIETRGSNSKNDINTMLISIAEVLGKKLDYKKEREEVANLYDKIMIDYPMLIPVFDLQSNYNDVDNTLANRYVKYINLVDGETVKTDKKV